MFLCVCVCCDGISLGLKPTLEPKLAGDKANAEAGNYIPIDNSEAEHRPGTDCLSTSNSVQCVERRKQLKQRQSFDTKNLELDFLDLEHTEQTPIPPKRIG
jgi:hypothetical protein